MKKMLVFSLIFLLSFSSVPFIKNVKAETEYDTTSISDSTQFESKEYNAVGDKLESENVEIQRDRDGDDSYELGYIISHGLLGKPVSSWHEGSFDFPAESLVFHYNKHKGEVNAKSAADYLNKAIEYRRTAKKGSKVSKVSGEVSGVKRYKKNGKYIDLAPDGRIVSFGKQ